MITYSNYDAHRVIADDRPVGPIIRSPVPLYRYNRDRSCGCTVTDSSSYQISAAGSGRSYVTPVSSLETVHSRRAVSSS
ncbi:hypothetical protein SAMN04489841_2663 [Natrinema salaciae]|uniref:Uncharacterized protein n=1 Tax=Natrinema salaciae TaxID=1186196 RepID=A0A1H9JRV0_9EURY|nr:hypothetical protein SAMN04489841_2663 [Natrinema salaciae]